MVGFRCFTRARLGRGLQVSQRIAGERSYAIAKVRYPKDICRTLGDGGPAALAKDSSLPGTTMTARTWPIRSPASLSNTARRKWPQRGGRSLSTCINAYME